MVGGAGIEPATLAVSRPSSERMAVTLAVTAHRKTGKPAQLGACSLLLCRGYPTKRASGNVRRQKSTRA